VHEVCASVRVTVSQACLRVHAVLARENSTGVQKGPCSTLPVACMAAAAAARRASPRLPVPMPGALSVASITELVFSCFSTPMADVHIDVWCIATLH
jgi:hypothetical protein